MLQVVLTRKPVLVLNSDQQLTKSQRRRRFRDVLLEPTKVWERLDNGFAAAFWRPEGPTTCCGAVSVSLSLVRSSTH